MNARKDERSAIDSGRIERFCKTTRWFHWTFALSFLGLAFTGALLFLREELSLAEATVDTLVSSHEVIAVVFLTAPWLIVASGDTRGWLSDIEEIIRFGRHDLDWLLARAQPWKHLELPDQDKLNAGQKLNALSVVVIASLMTGTGLHLWREPGAFLAVALHVAGFAAWIPGFAVHFYMAVLNPETRPALRGMLLGVVDRAWARHHHARWVAERERP